MILILMEVMFIAALGPQTRAAIHGQNSSSSNHVNSDDLDFKDADKILRTTSTSEFLTSLRKLIDENTAQQKVNIEGSATKKIIWTILIYIDADNNLEKYAVRDIEEMLKGAKYLSDCTCVLIQIDRHPNYQLSGYSNKTLPGETKEYTGARRYQIANNGSLIFKQDLGEVNMGNGNTLRNFVRWGKQQCPSEKLALIIWDHGYGDAGVAKDETNGKDRLQLQEIRKVLEDYKNSTGKAIDMLGFDACYMGSAEVITEFNGLTTVLVGSEDIEPVDGWDYKAIFREFGKADCNKTAWDLGTIIVGTYGKFYDAIKKNKTTLIAIDMSYVPKFQRTMRTFTKRLVEALKNDAIKWEIARAIEWARNHSYEMKSKSRIDLYHFLQLLQRALNDVSLRKYIQEVLDVILYMRFARHGGRSAFNATGISIYFMKNSSITYTYDGAPKLKFNDTTCWQELIELFTKIFRNSTYREWVRNHPVSPASLVEVIGSIYPSSKQKTPPTSPFIKPEDLLLIEQGIPFDVSLSIPQGLDFPQGGWIHIYEYSAGKRVNWDPIESIWIDNLAAGTTYDFTITWRPLSFGWVSLDMEFQPYNPNAPTPQLPGGWYDPFSFDFILDASGSYYIPPLNDTLLYPLWSFNSTEIFPGDDVALTLELINSGTVPFSGGNLDILATNMESGDQVLIHQETLPVIQPGDSYIINSIFTMDTPGMWEFSLDLDNEPLPLPDDAPKEWSPGGFLDVIDPMDIGDHLVVQPLLDDGTGLFNPIDLPYHGTNWTGMPLYLEFLLPAGVSPPPISFDFSIGNSWYSIYTAQSTISPQDWVITPDGDLSVLIGPLPEISPTSLYSGVEYDMYLFTNVTGDKNVLDPALWTIMQQPDPTLPDIILRSFDILDVDDGNFLFTVELENAGASPVNGTNAEMCLSSILPNGTSTGCFEFFSGLPSINPGETVTWSSWANYSEFSPFNGFHEIIAWSSYYPTATYDRSVLSDLLYLHDDPFAPIVSSVDSLIDEPIIEIPDPLSSPPVSVPFTVSDTTPIDVIPMSPTLPDDAFDVFAIAPFSNTRTTFHQQNAGGTLTSSNITINITVTFDPSFMTFGTHQVYLFVVDEAYNVAFTSFVIIIPQPANTTPTSVITTTPTTYTSTTTTEANTGASNATEATSEESKTSENTTLPTSVTSSASFLALILSLTLFTSIKIYRYRKGRKR